MKSRMSRNLSKMISVIVVLGLFVGLLPAQAINVDVKDLLTTVGSISKAEQPLDNEMIESDPSDIFPSLPDLSDLALPETFRYDEAFPAHVYIPVAEHTSVESARLDSAPSIANQQLPEMSAPIPEEQARMAQLMVILGSSTYFSELSEQDSEFVCSSLNVGQESMRELESLGLKVVESLPYAQLMTAYGFPADRLLNEYSTQEDCIELDLKMSAYLLTLSDRLVGTELDFNMRKYLFYGMTFEEVQAVYAISRIFGISMDALMEGREEDVIFPEWMSDIDRQNYLLLAADFGISAQVLVNYAMQEDVTFQQVELLVARGQRYICELSSDDNEPQRAELFSASTDGKEVDKYIVAPYSYSHNDSESVNLNNGALVYEKVDTVIPGRNGLDLVIGRRFDSSDAGIYTPTGSWYDEPIYNYVVTYGYKAYSRNYTGEWTWSYFDLGPYCEIFPYRSAAINFTNSLKTTIITDFNNQTPPTDLILRPYSRIDTVIVGYDSYAESTTTPNSYLRNLYGLGQGWSFLFSSIENGKYLHLADGRTFEISITSTAGDSNLKDYTLKDLRIERESGKYSNGTVSSSYTLYYKDGKQEFFSSDGKLIGMQDRFGNTIKFVNTTANNLPCITITDTLGRIVIISGTGTVGAHTMTVKLPDDNTIRYTAEPISGHNAYSMAKFQNQLDVTTSYSYNVVSGGFNVLSKNTSAVTNFFLNLSIITHPTNAQTKYEYEKATHNLGADGLQELYRIKSRVDCIGTIEYNKQSFSYSTNTSSGYPNSRNPSDLPASYEYSTTVTEDGLITAHTFNHKHLRTNIDSKVSGIQKQQTLFEYNNDKLPVKQTARTYGSGSMYMENIELFTYDSFGNVLAHHDPQAKGNTSNTENRTEFSYDSRYQILTAKSYKRDSANSIREEYELYPDGKAPRLYRIYENNNLKSETEYTYDSYGNVTQQSVGGIRVTNFEYKNGGPLARTYTTGVQDADGALVASRTSNAVGIIDVSYQYDNMGNVAAHTDGNGAVTSYIYDKTNRVTRITYPNGSNRQYDHKDVENTLRVTDENGSVTVYGYNALGKLAYEQDYQTGQKLKQYGYDSKQRLLEETNINGSPQGYFTIYTYDALDRLLAQASYDKDNELLFNQTFVYDDAAGNGAYRKVQKTVQGEPEAPSMITAEYYDNIGRLTAQSYTNGATEYTDTFTYDYGDRRLSSLTALDASEGRAYSTKWEYDFAGRMVKETNALGQYSSTEYNGAGDKVKVIDPKGSAVEYRYDALGRLLEMRQPFDSRTASTKYYYDRNGSIVRKTTDTRTEAYTYDVRGNLLTANAGEGIVTTYTHDNLGNVLTMRTGENQATKYTYDRFGNVLTMTDPLGQVEQYHYDVNSNLLEKTDRNGTRTAYTRDGLGRQIMAVAYMRGESDNTFIQTDYYLTGALRYEENSYGLSAYTYDETGSLIKENTEETTKTYEYNIGKLRTRFSLIFDGPKLENSYEYDALGRLQSVTGSGTAATYTYDANGNRATLTYGNGVVTTYAYNKANLVTEVSSEKAGVLLSQYNYSYYLDGNQSTKTDHTGKMTTYAYNAAGALKREDELQGAVSLRTYDYAYDSSNNRKQMTVTGVENYTTTYKYDTNNRLRDETRVDAGNIYTTDYYYDPNGNMVSSVRGAMAPAMGATSMLSVGENLDGITLYEYDGFNRQTEVRTEGMTASYDYLPNGLRSDKSVNGVTTYYCWDGDQLVYEGAPSPMYECVIPSGGFACRLPSLGLERGKTYWLEVDGVVTECVAGSEPIDPRDPPVYQDVPPVYIGAGTVQVRDFLGASVNQVNINGQAGQTVRIYRSNPEQNKLNTVYLRGLNLIASVRNGSVSYYLYNAHGDVVQLTDSTGTVTKEYDYDAFGNERNPSAADMNPFRYCGEYLDPETNTYYLRARYYAPTTGRFMSEDPLRDGLNYYTYCVNNPVFLIDPSGMASQYVETGGVPLPPLSNPESNLYFAKYIYGKPVPAPYTEEYNSYVYELQRFRVRYYPDEYNDFQKFVIENQETVIILGDMTSLVFSGYYAQKYLLDHPELQPATDGARQSMPQDYLSRALNQQGLKSAPGGLKQSWTEGGYKYEVRIHPGESQYTGAQSIYRVSRQQIPTPGAQGTGTSYLGTDGIWYHTSVLREYLGNGQLNPIYDANAAKITHILLK